MEVRSRGCEQLRFRRSLAAAAVCTNKPEILRPPSVQLADGTPDAHPWLVKAFLR